MPRVLIEAMAVGLPCLSTPVNGIPELLDAKYLFDPDDVEGFTNKIESLLHTPSELKEMSVNNLEHAQEYKDSVLQSRRDIFYKKLKCIAKQ